MATKDFDKKINPDNIVRAGKNLKGIVYAILSTTIILISASLIMLNSGDIETIEKGYYFLAVIILISNLVILSKLYSAGDSLEKLYIKEVMIDVTDNSEKLYNPTLINYVKYKTDKGIVEIAPCHNLIGEKAYVNNGQSAPDGKYKYGFLLYFHVKDGIIIK